MIRFSDYLPLLISQFNTMVLPQVYNTLVVISMPALVGILFLIFWPMWVNYVRSYKISKTKYVVFEIRLPKETIKSPKAMDLLLHALHNTSDGSNLKQYWYGETRPWYSLEIISIEGQVKFMMWGEAARKVGMMSALYAQFPGIEVKEIEDYTKGVHYDAKTMKVWAAEFELTKSDPYPIKTYIDYGLDKDPKEEFKVDPLVPGIEFLGNIGANQQVWIQFLIRAHKAEQTKKGTWFQKTDDWKDAAQAEMDKIMNRDPKTKSVKVKEEEKAAPVMLNDYEDEAVKAISRSISKLPFDTIIRTLYIAKKEDFDTPFGMGGIISFFKNFSSESLNGFKPKKKWTPTLDAPWKDYKDKKRNIYAEIGIMAYKMRSGFYPPFESSCNVFNTEELATMYHFPGSVSTTPTLDRVPSKKGEAPANLPV